MTVLKDDGLFSGRRTKLRLLLKDMGFRYRKQDNRRYYYEQPRIIEQRHTYLRKIMHNRVEKRPVVFLDETWANSHDGKDLAWVEEDTVTGGTLGGVKRPPGKGTRLIILGAGGEMGWIPNTTLIFRSNTAKNLVLFSHQYWRISVPNSTPTSYLRSKTHRCICNHIYTLLSDKYSNICGCCKTNILFHDALESFL